MRITFKVKQAGRKHALLDNRIIEIEDIGETSTLENLIAAVVKQQLEQFNRKPIEKNILPFLSNEETARQAQSGKVSFGSIYNESKADLDEAQKTALTAFEDGLFSVFAGDQEIRNLDDFVSLNDSTVITFVRLSFLAGSYW